MVNRAVDEERRGHPSSGVPSLPRLLHLVGPAEGIEMVADARFSKVPSDRVEIRGVDSYTGALVWRAVWTDGQVWIDARCVMDMPEALEPLNLNFGHAVGQVMVDHEGALLRAADFVDDEEHLQSVLEIFALLAAVADGGVA